MAVNLPASGTPDKVAITHPEKVVFPALGLTKGDVADFYRRIARRLLPHLRDRPVTLERLPDGVGDGKKHFWQKDIPPQYPDWIPRAELPTEGGKIVRYALVNDVDTLLYLVNQGALTFHVWLSRVGSLDRPDFVLFDLDPGETDFPTLVQVAQRLHAILRKRRARDFLKTSGKSGLHVLVPWTAEGGYAASSAWAKEVAEQLAVELPELATLETRKADRGRRVFVDVLHNNRGHHVVPPYVLRATPQASVSTPLSWRELTPELEPRGFNVHTIFDRLARRRDLLASLLRQGEAAGALDRRAADDNAT
ncbi:MAG TPA: non-homologous end-joining DNA ligase [Gemmataceae bacterium]|jgi:bifunctional non-homologous end joining protein LigD